MVAAERGGAVNASAEEESAASIVVYCKMARAFHVDGLIVIKRDRFSAPVTGVFAPAGTGGKTAEAYRDLRLIQRK